jgi:hypothetical protein
MTLAYFGGVDPGAVGFDDVTNEFSDDQWAAVSVNLARGMSWSARDGANLNVDSNAIQHCVNTRVPKYRIGYSILIYAPREM